MFPAGGSFTAGGGGWGGPSFPGRLVAGALGSTRRGLNLDVTVVALRDRPLSVGHFGT